MSDDFDDHAALLSDEEDDFDGHAAIVGIDAAPSAPSPAAEPAKPTGMDYLLALANGASLGVGGRMERMVPSPAQRAHPEAQFEGPRGAYDSVPKTTSTEATRLAGKVIPYALATRIPGGPAVQGALTGAAEAFGNDENVLGGAAVGGATGGLLGGASRLAGGLAKPAAQGAQQALPGMAQPGLSKAAELAARYGQKATKAFDDLEPVKGLTGKAYELGLKALDKLGPYAGALGKAAPAVGGALGGATGDEAAALGRAAGSVLGASPASAQDAPPQSREMRTAPFGSMPAERHTRVEIGQPELQRWNVQTGDAKLDPLWNVSVGDVEMRDTSPAATQAWAVESVLHQGTSDLSPEDEKRLTDAVMNGDREKLATQTFLMSGRYPGFASALQKQMQRASREEEQ